MRVHVDTEHCGPRKEAPPPEGLRCPFCLYQSNDKNRMIDHVLLHRGTSPSPSPFARSGLTVAFVVASRLRNGRGARGPHGGAAGQAVAVPAGPGLPLPPVHLHQRQRRQPARSRRQAPVRQALPMPPLLLRLRQAGRPGGPPLRRASGDGALPFAASPFPARIFSPSNFSSFISRLCNKAIPHVRRVQGQMIPQSCERLFGPLAVLVPCSHPQKSCCLLGEWRTAPVAAYRPNFAIAT